MAWNPSPEVAVARDAAVRLEAIMTVVVFVRDDGSFGFASYGRNAGLCAEAGKLGDELLEAARKHFEDDGDARPAKDRKANGA